MATWQLLAWITDPWTFIIVGIVAVLLFGKRLPEVGRSLGRGIAEFKRGLRDVQDELNKEPPPEEPPSRRLREPPAGEPPAGYLRTDDARARERPAAAPDTAPRADVMPPPQQAPPVSDVPPIGWSADEDQKPS